MGTKALASNEVGAAVPGDQVRDPFQGGSRPVASAIVAPEPEHCTDHASIRPHRRVCPGNESQSNFYSGRDQIVIIDGRMYSKGQQLLLDVEDELVNPPPSRCWWPE